MPKLILWEVLLTEKLVLLTNLLHIKHQLIRFNQSSGNDAMLLYFYMRSTMRYYFMFGHTTFLSNRQECGVRDERKRELDFLEKVW